MDDLELAVATVEEIRSKLLSKGFDIEEVPSLVLAVAKVMVYNAIVKAQDV